MNKREFVAGGMAAVVAAPALGQATEAPGAPGALRTLLTRTRRLPDLAECSGADTFEAYVGQRFDIVAGPGAGHALVLRSVERVARCERTEQFNLSFAPAGALAASDGVRLLAHATGQRLALHLEHGNAAWTARLNLLA